MFAKAVAGEAVPGISGAVADRSGVVWAQAYGMADLENAVPMTPLHTLRVGSVAKVITAAAMMRLYDQEKVELDTPVAEYVEAWPAFHPTITLRQLASHTSGVRHYKDGANEFLLNDDFVDVDSALALFKSDPLLFSPGTAQQYSTFAWTLISAALEGADKPHSFPEIVQREVIVPLALESTYIDDQYRITPHRPRPYSYREGHLINSPQTDHSYKWAGGGFVSSPTDVSRFAVAHLDGDYLQPSTVGMMFNKAKLSGGDAANFGIGWMVGFNRYQTRPIYQNNPAALQLMEAMPNAVMHSGGSMGGTTMLIMCLDHARAVTVVKNVDSDVYEQSGDVFLLALETLSEFHLQE